MPRKSTSRLTHKVGVLHTRTRELLAASTVPRLEIYKATDIPPNWLWAFENGHVPDPSVNRVECLYNFLSSTPLEVK